MAKKKVQYLPESSCVKVIVYTVEAPYGRGKPGYLAETPENRNGSGDLHFTEDLWSAMAMPRKDWERWLPGLKQRTRRTLSTHQAVALLGVVEEE